MIRIQKATLVTNVKATALQVEGLTTDEIGLEIANDNAFDLADFDVAVRFDPDGAWHTIASVTGDYTSPAGFTWGASVDFTIMVKNTTAWLVFRGLGVIEGLRLQAQSSNATGSTLTIKGKAR